MQHVALPQRLPVFALRWPPLRGVVATADALDSLDSLDFLDPLDLDPDAVSAFRRFGLSPAVELMLGAGAAPPPTDHADAPAVLGLRVPIGELDEPDPDDTSRDLAARRMAELRTLRARRLVYALAPGAPELADASRARELGERLDAVATRFQAQGLLLGLGLAPGDGVERIAALVALATRITTPTFFFDLPGQDLPALLDDGWGRALAQLVTQIEWPLGPVTGDSDTADLSATASALARLPRLDAVILVPGRDGGRDAGEARGLRIATALEKLSKTALEGLSPRSRLP